MKFEYVQHKGGKKPRKESYQVIGFPFEKLWTEAFLLHVRYTDKGNKAQG